jgi:hypothetical protein
MEIFWIRGKCIYGLICPKFPFSILVPFRPKTKHKTFRPLVRGRAYDTCILTPGCVVPPYPGLLIFNPCGVRHNGKVACKFGWRRKALRLCNDQRSDRHWILKKKATGNPVALCLALWAYILGMRITSFHPFRHPFLAEA